MLPEPAIRTMLDRLAALPSDYNTRPFAEALSWALGESNTLEYIVSRHERMRRRERREAAETIRGTN